MKPSASRDTNSPSTQEIWHVQPSPSRTTRKLQKWDSGKNRDTATQQRTLTGRAKYHCDHCTDATPVWWHAALPHTDRGWTETCACNATTTTTTTTTTTEENLPHCYDPTLIIQVTLTSARANTQANTQGVEETMRTPVEKRQRHVLSQSKLKLFSCHGYTHLTSGFHLTQSLRACDKQRNGFN